MEFKAIVDTKARNASGCAVVGVYENGDLGAAASQIDVQIGGIIGRLIASGDFAGKLGVLAQFAGLDRVPKPLAVAEFRRRVLGQHHFGMHDAGLVRKILMPVEPLIVQPRRRAIGG